jgi:hypothetical protein
MSDLTLRRLSRLMDSQGKGWIKDSVRSQRSSPGGLGSAWVSLGSLLGPLWGTHSQSSLCPSGADSLSWLYTVVSYELCMLAFSRAMEFRAIGSPKEPQGTCNMDASDSFNLSSQ